jgi:hypothetical protein
MAKMIRTHCSKGECAAVSPLVVLKIDLTSPITTTFPNINSLGIHCCAEDVAQNQGDVMLSLTTVGIVRRMMTKFILII